MNIAIIERNLENNENAKKVAGLWKKILEERGHTVRVVNRVLALPGLGDFDVAIVHPTSDDSKLLIEEIAKRITFRVMLHTIETGDYPDFCRESPQICSFFAGLFVKTMRKKIIKLVEKGW